MSVPTIDDLLLRNETHHVAKHEPLPYFHEVKAPGHTFIISCIDPRVIPENIFNLRPQDNEAVIIRTAAGHPQPALNSVLALDAAFGCFKQIILLHHTDCGATYFTEEGVREKINARCPGHPEVDQEIYGAIDGSIENDLRKDLGWLKSHPLLPAALAEKTRAFVYDIKTGKLDEVK